MKIIITLCILIAGINAFPQEMHSTFIDGIKQENDRLVTGSIVTAIEEFCQNIKDAGLDPYHIQRADINNYALPVPILFNLQVQVEELLLTGISNIVVHNIDYNIITNRLTFDIGLPRIELSLGKVNKNMTVLGSNTDLYQSGKLAIVGIRLRGNIRINIRPISGISIRSIEMNFDLGGIESGLKIVTHGKDLSYSINWFFGKRIPDKLNEYSKEINDLLDIVIKDMIETNM